MRLLTRTAATSFLALGLTMGVGAAAFAVDEPGPVTPAPSEGQPENARNRCLGAINRRVVDLANWSKRINDRANLTQPEKDALIALMTQVSNDLTNIAKPAVVNAIDKTALRAACKAVFTDYRVYLVVHPKVFITAAAEGWVHRISDLQGQATALGAAGKDVTVINALLAHALGLASPIPGTLAVITPASYNLNPAATKIIFNTARGNLETVREDVREAARRIHKLNKPHNNH